MKTLNHILGLLLLAFVSCNSGSSSQTNSFVAQNDNMKSTKKVEILRDNSLYASIEISENGIRIEKGEFVLTSKLKGDKRKYYNNDVFRAEIKYKENSLKLRNEQSQLIWKVKFYDEKIKISDNEENLNPFEIKYSDNTKIKLKKDDVELGRMIFEDQVIKIKTTSGEFTVSGEEFGLAYGVLMIDDMLDWQQLILLAEFLDR